MGSQTIAFRGDDLVLASAEITPAGAAWHLLCRFHPDRADSDATATIADPDELADVIEEWITGHYRDQGSRLRTIKWTEGAGPIEARHLSRFAVPLLKLDTGGV